MKRLYCRLFGHNWRHVGWSTCLACTRCHENGWEL